MASLATVAPSVNVSRGVASGIRYTDPDRMMLFARGRPLTLARYPNHGDSSVASGFVGLATMSAGYVVPTPNNSSSNNSSRNHRSATLSVDMAVVPNAISYSRAEGANGMTGRPEQWVATGGAPQLAVHGAFRFQWADQMLAVARVDTTNGTFVFEKACVELHYWPPVRGSPYYVVDLLQELDSPGEWWLDRSTGLLYVYVDPPPFVRGCEQCV